MRRLSDAENGRKIGGPSGRSAKRYIRKWQDPKAVVFTQHLIQDGARLGKCLFHINLNMVRTGVVRHPSE